MEGDTRITNGVEEFLNPEGNWVPSPTDETTMLSSQQGEDYKNQADKTLGTLDYNANPMYKKPDETDQAYLERTQGLKGEITAGPRNQNFTETPESKQTEDYITYINPETGQSQKLLKDSITPDAVRSLINNGYSISESSGNVPSWALQGNPDLGAKETEMVKAEQDEKDLVAKLNSFMVSDQQLQGQVNAITAQYEARIADMKRINERREKTFETLGVRTGARWTGGMFGGVIAEEERQGVQRIADLESQKLTAIATAQEAARSKNWEVYVKQVDIAEKAHKEKVDALNKLNETIAANNKQVAEQLFELQKLDIQNQQKTQESVDNILKDAAKNGLTDPAIKKAISESKSVSEAITAAGDYLETGTGIVGEYLYYKKQAKAAGQVPVGFDTYQTMDANRKAKATNGSGLDSSTLTKVQTIANQFDGEQIVKDYNQILQSLEAVKTAGDTPTDDIQRVYAFAKIMDPNSVVREGEYKIVQDYSSAVLEKMGIKAKRIFDNTGFLTQEARDFMLTTLNNRFASTEKAYNNLYSEYGRRINKITKMEDGTDYITDYSKAFETGNTLVEDEKQAETKLNDYLTNNPEKVGEIQDKIKLIEDTLGRSINSLEFFEAFPEYK